MIEFVPDSWVILYITSETDPPIRRVFAGWPGKYMEDDAWRASSGITNTIEFDDHYEFDNYSGNKYICYKNRWGMNNIMTTVFNTWQRAMTSDMKIVIEDNPNAKNNTP